jgi:hypothetical protein
MARSSLTGTEGIPPPRTDDDTRRLGPSDSSDSGSDTLGQRADLAQPDDSPAGPALEPLEGAADAAGTGERADAEGDAPRDGADILPDRIVGAHGGTLDAADREALEDALRVDEADEDNEDNDDTGDDVSNGEPPDVP